MAASNGWSRSDSIAAGAAAIAGLALLLQVLSLGDAKDLQRYVDKTQTSGRIIDAVEQVISARQTAMVQISGNYYEPQWRYSIIKAILVEDGKTAGSVLTASGALMGAIQNSVRFWKTPQTIDALKNLTVASKAAIKCFTDLASAGHRLDDQAYNKLREDIAVSCEGQNKINSLDALKQAEAVATAAMAKEAS